MNRIVFGARLFRWRTANFATGGKVALMFLPPFLVRVPFPSSNKLKTSIDKARDESAG